MSLQHTDINMELSRLGEVEPALKAGESPGPDLLERLYVAFESQIEQVEQRLKVLLREAGAAPEEKADMAEIDRTVKTLASLTKTLGLLMDLRKTSEATAAAEREAEDASHVDDPEQLRREIARRLGGLVEDGSSGTGAGRPQPGGDPVSAL